jgi:hypothetical protein
MKGLTIVQLMVIIAVVGIIAKIVVEVVIDKRCQDHPSLQLCAADKKAN